MKQDNLRIDSKNIVTIVRLLIEIALITFVLCLCSVKIGRLIDHALQTSPIFTLLLVLIGLGATIFITFKLAHRAMAKLSFPKATTKKHPYTNSSDLVTNDERTESND